MKQKIFSVLLACSIALVGCSEPDDGKVEIPSGSSFYEGKTYQEVVEDFEESGFTNIKLEPIDDLILGFLTNEDEIEQISVDGDINFGPSDRYFPDVEVIISYHTFPETEKPSDSETESEPVEEVADEIVTIENNDELAAVLSVKDEFDPIIGEFVTAHQFAKIEFDAHITNVAHYDDYDSRFDLLLCVDDYRTENFYGPNIKIENIGILDYPEVENSLNQNVHVVATVWEYNENQGLLILHPISVENR